MSIGGAEQLAEPAAQRERRARARRERDVVRHRRPEAHGRDARLLHASWSTPTIPVGPSYRDACEAQLLDQLRSLALPVTGDGRVCGTSASSEPSVTTSSTPSSLASPTTMLAERPPADVRLDPEQQHGVAIGARDRRVEEGVVGPVDLPRDAVDERDLRPGRLEVEEALRIDVREALARSQARAR